MLMSCGDVVRCERGLEVGKLGGGEEAWPLPPDDGSCIDCEDDRRKKGIEDGVSRLDCARLIEVLCFNGPDPVGADSPAFVALFEPSERLLSGVLD